MVIDTDAGVDDAVALWWALTDPRIDVVGIIVTWGNVGRDTAFGNVCRILTAAGRVDVPVVLGADGPVGPTPLETYSHRVHGTDGLGGHAAEWPTGPVTAGPQTPAELLASLPDDIDLVTLGPLSSMAQALDDNPSIAQGVRSLTVMGGAVGRGGNSLPAGEANIAHDPSAAAAVLTAGWTTEELPLLVGLDVTLLATVDDDDLALADEGRTVAARFLAGPMRHYAGFYHRSRQTAPHTSACHDLLATIAAVDPTVVPDTPTYPLAVDTGGSAAWGATIADRRPVPQNTRPYFTPWRIALTLHHPTFRAALHTLFT
jgi:purine nucleosidase